MTPENLRTVRAIANRAVVLYHRFDMLKYRDTKFARFAIADEIATVHNEIMPLRLADWLAADDIDFVHDIAGIHRHLSYQGRTPVLTGCFCPRFSDNGRIGPQGNVA